jgi:ribosome recycling factor
VRNARQDANKEIKKVETSDDIKKDAEERVQKLTDKYIKKVEEVLALKETEILKV